MAASWSNIYCQMITEAGPILGEGLLEGFQTSIELESFDWTMDGPSTHKEQAAGGMAGAVSAVGGALGLAETREPEIGKLILHKRFDIASSMIHTCCDNQLKVLSASITVLHIATGGPGIHMPGFILVATDALIEDVTVTMDRGERGVEVKERVTLRANGIAITYMRKVMGISVPAIPFAYVKTEASSGPSLPGGF
jgi:type VI protein secretion system component Hcp